MKLIYKLLFTVGIAVLLSACKNFDEKFADYKYTAGYFPYQYPVRTLVLGDYIYDNSNDNAHKFIISVAMGGVYENKMDREFKVAVDESLCRNLLFSSGGDEVKPLPSKYYSLSSQDNIVIPKGKFNGGIEVQLTDEFFEDPLAIKNTYVVPIKIISSIDVDSIIPEKNFTLFCVKFINEFHGTYFHYGKSSVKDLSGKTVEETAYDTYKFIEDCPLLNLITTGQHQALLSLGFKSKIFTGDLSLLLNFNGNNCTISSSSDSKYIVTGTGEYKSKAYSWGNKERDGLILNYTVKDENGSLYTASDVLVIRDRDVVMELFSPVEKN
ncbi:DUF5627 domain-containing protein [Parabacteroides sp. AF17-28]|uniref:BT_3987 domain-containing protein n=1 Tax=Parabacteroides sp. AF17-28 TaxID=2292241 RepID=UPI000EFEFB2E|nr:DUF5627 domain-containing protein [Parabacteroides sp. AF17-28]RHR56931.1 DUF1735 domain-containing protein [Parabacteroides sp. AF17-28]